MDGNQLWVRNAEGKVWGPLPPNQILLLLERKLISDITEASRDGRRFSPAEQEPTLAAAVAKGAPAGARQRTVSGVHTVWRPSSASSADPAPSSSTSPGTAAPRPAADRTASSAAPVIARAVTAAPPAQPAAVKTSAPAAPAPPTAPTPPPATIIQAVPAAGRLEEHSPLKLYYLIAAAETQGKLTVGEGRAEVSIWFKQGTPHAIESAGLGLGAFLIEQRVLSAAQLASAEPQIRKLGGDVASGLFTAGLLNPQTAFPLIQQHAQTLLQRGLLQDHGPFTFDPSVPPPASGFQLGQRWQLLSATARRIDSLRLRTWIHGREALVPQVAGSTAELQLTAQETRLLGHLDGTRSLAGAMALAGAQAETLQRLLLLLTEIDRLVWGGSASAAESSQSAPAPARARTASVSRPPPVIAATPPPVTAVAPVAPTPRPGAAPTGGLSGAIAKAMADNAAQKAAAPQPATSPKPGMAAKPTPKPGVAPTAARPAPQTPPTAAKPVAAQVKSAQPPPKAAPAAGSNLNLPALAKLLEDLKTKDLFARLKVDRSSAAIPMLKSNYFQLAKLYHPDTVPPDGPEEARRIKADILSLLNEANGVLSDDAKRVEYLLELEARDAVGDVDVEAILKAEDDFQQAIVLARARKFSDALTLIEGCIKANAKEGEFYAWRGYCRFFGSQEKRSYRDMAIEDQKKALTLNPKCVVAWQFQGQIWKLLEDIPRAKEAFQKTLELDPNNIEAQRELRLFEQRKR